jgi:hypothetical protein
MAPSHDAVHGRACLLNQAFGRFETLCLQKTEQNESGNRRLTALSELVPTVPEIRYLLARILLRPPFKATFIMAWSLFRRKHQANAALAHYKKQQNTQL